jgi:hypothetical protein
MAKTEKKKELTGPELLKLMRTEGIEQLLPGTERVVHVRSIDAPAMLREGKMPDILTPLLIRSVYQDLDDDELRRFLGEPRENINEALALLETMDFVCKHALMDGTELDDLTLAEKRWIFRLAMGPAEILTTFRYEPNPDVANMDEGEQVQQVTQ